MEVCAEASVELRQPEAETDEQPNHNYSVLLVHRFQASRRRIAILSIFDNCRLVSEAASFVHRLPSVPPVRGFGSRKRAAGGTSQICARSRVLGL